MKIIYYINIATLDGNCSFSFEDESDLMNFIWDIENHVYDMSLAYTEEKI